MFYRNPVANANSVDPNLDLHCLEITLLGVSRLKWELRIYHLPIKTTPTKYLYFDFAFKVISQATCTFDINNILVLENTTSKMKTICP